MRVQIIETYGDADVFLLSERPNPKPSAGEVLVRMAASSVNPVDTKIRRGGAAAIGPALPAVLGCDVAGEVEAVGAGVSAFAVGDRVYGCAGGVAGMPGTYAEVIAADARLLAKAPRSLSLREAAALPLVTITAWEGLIDRARLRPGDTVLIQGGTGGVGHVAVQIAKAHGAKVFATVSSAEKAAIARGFGADEVINYKNEPVPDAVRRLTDGRGVDIVLDATGGAQIDRSFEPARLNGQIITIVSQYTADLTLMHRKGLTLHVVFMLIPMLHDVGRRRHGEILAAAAELVDQGKLRPLIDRRRFDLATVADAHRVVEAGEALGKCVIDVRSES